MAGKHLGLPPGVEFVGDTIRIRFTWRGATPPRRCETLRLAQTPKGINAATKLLARVKQLIDHQALDDDKYIQLFPNTSYSVSKRVPNFRDYAQVWLDSREIVAGTRRNYRITMNKHWMPYLALLPVNAISAFDIRKIVVATEWASTTAKRTALVRLRAVLRSAVNDGWLDKNPAIGIDLPIKAKRKLDPFTKEEADTIIEHLYTTLGGERTEIYACLIEFAFYTGMRPGEVRALRWDEIDETKRTARVCRIVVDGEVAERIKNRKPRNVLLNDRAMHALDRAKVVKEKIRLKTDFIFPPAQGGEWMQDPDGPTGYLRPALAALGIRQRRLYDTRHTYATMCLMAGMNVAFIANQLGHTIEVLLSTYAEWINSEGDWSEMNKLSVASIGTKLVQKESINAESP
ncbi:site-specific integrase [Pseudomonas sp.]|uniref:site-specific integrase n=1 Tax=Pseudomonas sp. TaxID=306 RepID=UPI00272FA9EC|nr:site-specific integrase [Pseudomonas sp.]MDP2447651.1 tyrosine-type recombinase/integrase [Pseudomonas sp.]MDZ4334311.1 tyrosine-type recombinase/integrase [Pseudomonas sp.]